MDIVYDTDTDQLVVSVPAADGDGDVESARIDVVGLDQAALDRLHHIREPDQPLPAPRSDPVTRRAG